MNIVIVGATRGMGKSLGRKLASDGTNLVLLARNEAELERCASDLRVRGAASCGAIPFDLSDSNGHASVLSQAKSLLGHIHAVVVTAGAFGTQEILEGDLERTENMLDLNFTKTVIFAEQVRKLLLAQPSGGTLCVFSSVAGDRPRKSVVLYGASKAGLSAYLEGLDLRFSRDGLNVLNVKPGFIDTSMTEGLPVPPIGAGDPDEVAEQVVRALRADRHGVIYAPPIWQAVMATIRRLPQAVMRRANF